MKRKQKNLSLLLLLLLMIGVTAGSVFSYWVGQVKAPAAKDESTELTIGAGLDATTELTINATPGTKKLVPAGKAELSKGGAAQNTEKFSTTYNVSWIETGEKDVIDSADNVTGTLKLTNKKVLLADADSNDYREASQAVKNLLKIKFDPAAPQIVADGEAVKVTVEVTMDEPNKASYEQIANKKIKLELNFAVEDLT